MLNQLLTDALNTEVDVVIVGGGIVGATLAAALKNSGLRIILVESQTLAIAASRIRAYALTLLSGRIFEAIGIWEQIFPQIAKFDRIRLSDANFSEVVKFETKDLGTQNLGYVGEHKILLTALQNFLADCPKISWLSPARVEEIAYSEKCAELSITMGEKKLQLHSKLVIAADGATSPLRNWAGIKTRGWKYWQSCITFTIEHDAPSNDIAFERFWPTGPMGILPLPGNRCQIVWTMPHKRAIALQSLAESEFLLKLQEHTQGLFPSMKLVTERGVFPVQLMQSNRYASHRLALIGDAAHCCHPVGGQGLNLGIRDAAAIAQIIKKARERGEDIGSLSVLKRYENWRKPENLMILGFTDFLNRCFSNHLLPILLMRRFGIILLRNLPPLKIFALKLMTGSKGRNPQLV